MKPVDFHYANIVLAESQDEYQTLHAWRSNDDNEITTCWQLTWWERLKLLWTGELWLRQLTFGEPFQPQLPQVDVPPMTVTFEETGGDLVSTTEM